MLATAVLVAACSEASQPTSPPESTSLTPGKKPDPASGITVTDLGLTGSRSDSRAEDIDDQGRIVGSRGPWTGPMRAFLWTPTSPRGTTGSATDLGDLGGGVAQARGINASGQVVGSSTTPSAGQHAFLWDGGSMHDLGVPEGLDEVEAMDINDALPRRAAGGSASGDRAVVWTVSGSGEGFSVTARDVLPELSTSGSFAFALNDESVVVGYSNVPSGYENQPVSWSNSGTQWDPPNPLALLTSAVGGVARDINSLGQIVGHNVLSIFGCGNRAVVWPTGDAAAVQLPMLSGGTCAEAWAINDEGQISGFSANRRGAFRAALWRPLEVGYSVTDMGQLRGTTPQVLGMNEPLSTGVEVVGFGRSRNGAEHATLWTVR